jgi:lysophospholipase L1-like esterase
MKRLPRPSSAALLCFAIVALLRAASPAVGSVALKPATSLPPSESWVGAWEVGSEFTPPLDGLPKLQDQTVRQITFLHYGGNFVRVRFSNEFGSAPLAIGSATVALSAGGAAINPSTLQVLTFGGASTAILAPHTKRFSDPVAMPVAAGSSLAISSWLTAPYTITTWHPIAEQENYISLSGNHTRDSGGGNFPTGISSYLLLDGVDVGAAAGTGAVVGLGDSITDGYGSTFGANMRWPDQFASRLQSANVPLSVLNAGMSGGRVLHDSFCAGPSALHRFPIDVVAQSGARYVVLLEGINDIVLSQGFPYAPFSCYAEDPPVNAADIIAGYQVLIGDAHAAGIVIYGATILPASLGGSLETMRETVNGWIRTSGAFDAVIDFDAALRNPSIPTELLPAYDSGDHVHPNDAGYAAMAQTIPLTLFSSAGPRRTGSDSH